MARASAARPARDSDIHSQSVAPVSSAASGGRRCARAKARSEEHTSELQSPCNIVCRLLLGKKKHVYTKTKCRSNPRGRLVTTPGYTLHSLPHHVGEPCIGHRYTLAVARPHHQPHSCVCPATLPRQLHNVPSSPTETTSQTVGL